MAIMEWVHITGNGDITGTPSEAGQPASVLIKEFMLATFTNNTDT